MSHIQSLVHSLRHTEDLLWELFGTIKTIGTYNDTVNNTFFTVCCV
jgi:hypothetical protein